MKIEFEKLILLFFYLLNVINFKFSYGLGGERVDIQWHIWIRGRAGDTKVHMNGGGIIMHMNSINIKPVLKRAFEKNVPPKPYSFYSRGRTIA